MCLICNEYKPKWVIKKQITIIKIILSTNYHNSNFGYIFTTDCTDYTDFSSQEATMAGCRTIRTAGAAEAQKIRIIRAIRCGKTLPNL